jgi:hypothetical protein
VPHVDIGRSDGPPVLEQEREVGAHRGGDCRPQARYGVECKSPHIPALSAIARCYPAVTVRALRVSQ